MPPYVSNPPTILGCFQLDEALWEHKPPWPKQIITPHIARNPKASGLLPAPGSWRATNLKHV